MILREGMGLTAIGLTLALLIALGGSRLIASFLFGVGAVDPITLLLTAAVIIGVAGVASYRSVFDHKLSTGHPPRWSPTNGSRNPLRVITTCGCLHFDKLTRSPTSQRGERYGD